MQNYLQKPLWACSWRPPFETVKFAPLQSGADIKSKIAQNSRRKGNGKLAISKTRNRPYGGLSVHNLKFMCHPYRAPNLCHLTQGCAGPDGPAYPGLLCVALRAFATSWLCTLWTLIVVCKPGGPKGQQHKSPG
jgi:hypothetical protein